MNEHLDSLEDAIQDLNKELKEVEKKEQVIVRFPSRKSTLVSSQNQTSTQHFDAQCTWRRSPPTNTTLNVSYSFSQNFVIYPIII